VLGNDINSIAVNGVLWDFIFPFT